MAVEDVEIGMLQQRKIEANVIKPIFEAMVQAIGREKASEIIEASIGQDAINAGCNFALKEEGQTTIESFVALQYLWTKGGALEVDVLEHTEKTYAFHVKRCKYAEMYQEMGLGEIGFLLSCNRDAKFIEGYAPHITLTRPHTIMQGDGYCDFCYRAS